MYQQAPYTDCSEEEYNEAVLAMPKDIDWSSFFEEEDNTIGQQTLACSAGNCEI